MKFGVVNKSTILNRFVFYTLQRNITHLAVITRKTNIKLGVLKGGGELEKSHIILQLEQRYNNNCLFLCVHFQMAYLQTKSLKLIEELVDSRIPYFTHGV